MGKLFSDDSLKKLISLFKTDIAKKEDKITATGILQKEEDGTISSVESIDVELIDLATVATTGSYSDLTNQPTALKNPSSLTIKYGSTSTEYDGSNVKTVTIPSVPTSASSLSAVSYASQTLTNAQKIQARTNIGAGTSSFSGSYTDLTNKPTNVSSFTNDAGYLTSHQSLANYATKTDLTNATAGLTGAMHFIGTATVAITNGSTTDPEISGYSTKTKGDVILYDTKEFVWSGSTWQELGDEGSHVLKTQKINGYALSGDITLSASDVGALPTSGGTLSGALTVDGNISSKYLQGTSTRNLTSASDKICVLDSSGQVYYRTKAQIAEDIGMPSKTIIRTWASL